MVVPALETRRKSIKRFITIALSHGLESYFYFCESTWMVTDVRAQYAVDMEASSQFLPPDIEAAVEAQHGGPVSVSGQHGKYVVMNIDVYGGVLNATPEELADSVAAIKRSLAQAAAGQTRDVDESFDELEARYGL
jgi:hypothetical protein